MNRVERYREIRINRRKLKLSLFLFFIMIIPGICISDYSINSLMKNENRIELITFDKHDNSLYLLNFLNLKIYLDTEYLEKDFREVKELAAEVLGIK